jgi:death-on-curing protein
VTYYLTVEQLQAWNAAHTEGGGRVRDRDVLEGALRRCEASAFGEDAYETLTSKAAALIHALASTQGFENGNKRTAWFACEAFLEINGVPLRAEISEIVAEVFVQSVANSLIPLARVVEWLVEHLATTVETDDDPEESPAVADTYSLAGADGELVSRILDLLDSTTDPRRIVDAGPFVELAIGDNSPLPGVVLVREGHDPVPGTVLAERVRRLRRVGPTEWLDLLEDRLTEIVEFGVAEDFLAAALRDRVTSMYERFANVGEAAANRERSREGLLATCDDEPALERFRQRVAERDPSVRELTIEQFAEQVRAMADRLLKAPDADEAVNHWAALDAWRRDVASLLSDDVVSTWSERRVFRGRE